MLDRTTHIYLIYMRKKHYHTAKIMDNISYLLNLLKDYTCDYWFPSVIIRFLYVSESDSKLDTEFNYQSRDNTYV